MNSNSKQMKRKRIFKIVSIITVAGILIGGAIGLYIFNMPHRDVQSAKSDYALTSTQIVSEYLADMEASNRKYLSADGESKILEITGTINKISEDFNGQKVILLKGAGDQAGVSASFTSETDSKLTEVEVGQTITIKGVIRLGASYDEDLELYENVIIEKSSIVKK